LWRRLRYYTRTNIGGGERLVSLLPAEDSRTLLERQVEVAKAEFKLPPSCFFP